MKKNLILATFVVAAAQAQAVVLFDDFNSGPIDLQVSFPTLSGSSNRTGSMIGGNAYHVMSIIANPDNAAARHRVNTSAGVLSVSNEELVRTDNFVAYGADSNGSFVAAESLNLNLLREDRFRLNFRSADLPLTARIQLFDEENSEFAVQSKVINPGSNFSVNFLFSDFAGAYTFADTDYVLLILESQPSGDFSLGSFEAVPEPASLAVLGLGAATMLRRRRK